MHRLSDPRAMMVEFCRCGGLFRDRRSVLAAVSGGADSVVLLHLLAESADELGLIEIAVGHVNHGIRAEAG
ncbi:MAG TPA: ATP-binding protein, partial [Myxococcota bacterium]|nr:ATP-binding protein [Myxococcota bacterium]